MEKVESIYSLSPMQLGMLFHTLHSPESKVYFQQFCFTLKGNLNLLAFEQAWQQVVERHPALRSCFYWQELDQPLQVVHPQVELPWVKHDWRVLSPKEQQEQLEVFLQADQDHSFALDQPPLIRFALFDLNEDTYYFVWTHHHLLLDGWSAAIILKEVFAFYEAFSKGENIRLDTPRSYRDYVAWLQQQDSSQSQAFWKQKLKGFTTSTPLGLDKALNGNFNKNNLYKDQELHLSPELTNALTFVAQEHHLTLNTLVQGAWAILLSYYSGEEDVVFGATVSGRPPAMLGVESIVGLFINTLPVRVQLSKKTALLAWLQQLQQQQLEQQQYFYSPLVEIHRMSDVPSGKPLFESIVVFENYPIDSSLKEQKGTLKVCDIRSFERNNYPITLTANLVGLELWLELSYQCQRFDSQVITRILGHLKTLLEAIANNPNCLISDLPILTAPERHQLLVEWNNTQIDYPKHLCIHQLLEAQLERIPDAVAVVFEDQMLSYAELNARANQLAHHLQTLGVGPEVLVGICVKRSLEMVIGLLGILKAGGAYVPIDPRLPQERLAFMLEDSQLLILLTQQELVESLPTDIPWVVQLDEDWEAIAQSSKVNPVTSVSVENLSYMIYTSGSTGKPKGVLLGHQGLVNYCLAVVKNYDLQSCDRILQFSSISFDSAVGEIFPFLMSGATVILRSEELPSVNKDLMQAIEQHKVTILNLPTAYWQQWVNSLSSSKQPLPQTLRLVEVGGEKASPTTLFAWKQISGVDGIRWLNAYGVTETTVAATVYEPGTNSTKQEMTLELPIGRPIANTEIYLLDRYLEPVPVGVPGEMYIGGVGLARGYLNRPELTAIAFIANPFREEVGARLYKTGDLARYLPDGNIEFLGRTDHQLKIRGFRIESGDIETALVQHPAVDEAVVILREDQPDEKCLVAYAVSNQEQVPTVGELQSFLKDKLPEYMMPAALVILDALPLTTNGKVDRRALPAPNTTRSALERDCVAPRTTTESVLVAIWCEVLRREQISIYDNFFELGGDSILSIQIVARAHEAGLTLTPQQLFDHQTIADLALEADKTKAIQAQQGLVTGSMPLTPIQHWFFEQNFVESHHFNQALMLEVPTDLRPALVEQVVRQLLAHHDALRLQFVPSASGWQQVNLGLRETVPFTVVDLSSMTLDEQQSVLEAAAAQAQTSLNFQEGRLIQVALFQLASNQPSRLLLVIHHLAIDGVSWRILVEDFSTLYQQLNRGEVMQLPPKTTAYQDWAQRLSEFGQSKALVAELDYWLSESRSRVPPLPVDYPLDKTSDIAAFEATVSMTLSVEETNSLLLEVPSVYNTQINDVLLTALVQTFTKWNQQDSLLVDLECHGREELFEDVNLSRTVGWFTSYYPILLKLEEDTNPGSALKSIKEQLRQVPKRGIGYPILRYLSQDVTIVEQLQSLPQAEVCFNYLGQFDQVLSPDLLFGFAKESSGPHYSPLGHRFYVLEVVGFIVESKLQLQCTYSKCLHQQSTVERLVQGLVEALQGLIAHCQSPDAGSYTPSDFPQTDLNQEELEELLASLSNS